MFAIGVCLFILVQGIHPFKQANVKSDIFYKSITSQNQVEFWKIFDKRRQENYDLPPVSDEFKSLVTSLFEYDPEKRLTISQALKAPWFSLETAENEEIPDIIEERRNSSKEEFEA